jgi:2-methylaconitate cis-trans-isomerase PrpF
MFQRLALSLAVMLALALAQAVAAEKAKAPKAQPKKDDKSSVNFQIQSGTSDMQNKKKKGVKSK